MDWQTFLRRRGEFLIVVGILIVVGAVFHWIPYKYGFLSFFYLPVLAAGYLMGGRQATLSAVMCVLLVVTYYFWDWIPQSIDTSSLSDIFRAHWDVLLNLAMWGGFLMLTGAVFGRVHERLLASWETAQALNIKLEQQAGELLQVNKAIEEKSKQLEQQTETLKQSNTQVEELKRKVEEALYSAMDPAVARLMIQGRLREQKSNISVLFCDLKGFTTFAHARNPEVALENVNHFYEVMDKVIESFHGHIDKYLGDGIMCEFGAPLEHEQHTLQAVVAGLMMQKKFREANFPWAMRVGIASGEAIVGLQGSRRRMYSAIGEVVNLAKRLEELCEPGCVFVDQATSETSQMLVHMEQVRAPGSRRIEDRDVLDKIAEKKRQLESDPQNADLAFAIGKLYFSVREASRALSYFRLALDLKPDDADIKVAYAEASIRRDEFEKVVIRGLGQKQVVFKAVGIADPLLDRQRFPESFYERFHRIADLIEIPDDVTLPCEVLDGTVGHSRSVAVLAGALAAQMDLPEETRLDLLVACRIQDLGKSAVGHHILNRRGGLVEAERKEAERHVDESVAIAKRMGYNRPEVLQIIGNHHELLNGEGYPRHIKGDEIPMSARIACIADVYCALTEARPYRNPWDTRVALRELEKGVTSGKYDATVVDTLCDLMA